MNLQLWTMVTLENSLIQIISFHITWFIYKKLTGSSLAYWKVLLLSLLGIIVSLGKGDGFYYQVIIFLGLALKETPPDIMGKSFFWSLLSHFYRFICNLYTFLCFQ